MSKAEKAMCVQILGRKAIKSVPHNSGDWDANTAVALCGQERAMGSGPR
jgi:hypothetical protein